MAVEFNNFGKNYNNYNLLIGQQAAKKAKEGQKEEVKEVEKQVFAFKGLENETDLLTQNVQALYGLQIGKQACGDKDIADDTNAILASLGFNYKVTPAQVASVAAGVKDVVLPALKLAEDGAVQAHIADPNGPFADLFA